MKKSAIYIKGLFSKVVTELKYSSKVYIATIVLLTFNSLFIAVLCGLVLGSITDEIVNLSNDK